MAALPTLLLLALALAITTTNAAAQPTPPQRERLALQAFLAGTPHERSLGWNAPSAPSPCLWFGVVCDASNATVVAVRLPGVGLVGALPASTLGNLRGLRTLSLRSNRLSGPIPADLLALPALRSLYLQGNRLSGRLPGDLPSSLHHLSLSGNELDGEIPESLDGLLELRSLRLDGNKFSGALPSLSALRRLEVFNVSYNRLNGSIPSSLGSRFPRESFAGNLQLCGEPLDRPCDESPSPGVVIPPPVPGNTKKRRLSGAGVTAIAVGAGAGALFALVLFVLCFVHRRRRRDANTNNKMPTPTPTRGFTPSTAPTSGDMGDITSSSKEIAAAAAAAASGGGESQRSRLVFVGNTHKDGYGFDLEDLLRASAEVLGKGGGGTSYKAVLEDGTTTVVVKRLKDVAAGRREFAAAVEALGGVEHRNLLPVRGYYFSKDEKLLIADHLPDGSLSAALHGSRGSGQTPMGWAARVQAALCAARGVAHLHAAHGLAHGNIKSSNLLLRPRQGDPDAAALLSDYGLQQLFAPPPPSARGGGYRAPELVDPRRPTPQSDVYSLGVLFLEILTGRSPAAAALDLPRWVQSVVREEWTAEVFDPELVRMGSGGGAGEEEEMVALLQVAMACAATAPDARPEAPEVVRMLEEIGSGSHGHGRATGEVEEEDRPWGTPPAGATP